MLCWKDKISQVWWSTDGGKWDKNAHPDNQSENQTLIFHSQLNQTDSSLAERHWLTWLLHTWSTAGALSDERGDGRAGEKDWVSGAILSVALQWAQLRQLCTGEMPCVCISNTGMFRNCVSASSPRRQQGGYVLPNGGHLSSFLQWELRKCKVKFSGTP